MKLKILIAVYNDWSSLDVLLGEIYKKLNQTVWKNYEVYIVNDASTIEIPEKNKKKIKIIIFLIILVLKVPYLLE